MHPAPIIWHHLSVSATHPSVPHPQPLSNPCNTAFGMGCLTTEKLMRLFPASCLPDYNLFPIWQWPSLAHSLTHSLTRSLPRSLYSLPSPTPSLTHPHCCRKDSLAYTLSRSLTHTAPTRSLTFSLRLHQRARSNHQLTLYRVHCTHPQCTLIDSCTTKESSLCLIVW